MTQLCYHFGSKHLMRRKLLPILLPFLRGVQQYREPFVGAGAIALSVMARHPRLSCWLNDIHPGLVSLWQATRDHPEELVSRVQAFDPNVPDFCAFKADTTARDQLLTTPAAIIELGFRQLAFTHMRWSGKGGSPRGGYSQRQPRIGERWSACHLSTKLKMISDRLSYTTCTCGDFEKVVEDTSNRAFLFVDPPYVHNENYYDCDFSIDDHCRLAELLYKTDHTWLLTYHDHPIVRALYKWAGIRTWTFNASERDTILIMPPTERPRRVSLLSPAAGSIRPVERLGEAKVGRKRGDT
jgi:DNA adenine methylase